MKNLIFSILIGVAACFVWTNAQAQDRLPQGITETQVRNHVIRPDHIKGVQDESQIKEFDLKIAPTQPQATTNSQKKLNSKKFATQFHDQMKNQVTGYVMQLRKNGQVNQTLIWNWSKTPANGGQGWTLDTRMHISSVSKMITGIAMYKLLEEKGISLNAKIINYLPDYWARGSKINQITFRQLLNHTSGFDTGDSASDFLTMKSRVSAGVANTGSYKYANMNFGLWRSNNRTEQCVAAFLPEGYEIVVFVNSPIGANGASLRNLVCDVYLSCLE